MKFLNLTVTLQIFLLAYRIINGLHTRSLGNIIKHKCHLFTNRSYKNHEIDLIDKIA